MYHSCHYLVCRFTMSYISHLLLVLLTTFIFGCTDKLKELKAVSFHKFVEVGVVDADLSEDGLLSALLDKSRM